MSSLDATVTAGLNAARVQTNRYLSIVVFIIGVLGNLFNVIIFSHPTLNQVPTSRYFLAASGASLASLTSGLLGRINAGWTVDPASYNTALCKFQAYTNKMGQTSCSYFILAAIIDRWLQSSRNIHYRQMSSIKNSTRVILTILIVFGIYHSIHAICYQAFLYIPPIKCYAGSTTCRYFENISYALITILVPQCAMLFFGWKTIHNIHHSRQSINPNIIPNINIIHGITVVTNQVAHRTKMRSLTRMLIIQMLSYILLTLPAVGEALYLTLTLTQNGSEKTDLQLAIDRFFFTFTLVLSYMAISLPFYLYTLTGTTFRQTLRKIITKMKFCFVHH